MPIATGGGPAYRAAMVGGDVAQAFAQGAIHVPEAIRVGQGVESLLQLFDGGSLNNGNLSLNEDSSSSGVTNSKGEPFPDVTDPRTGDPIPPPPNDLEVLPIDQRAPWGRSERGNYIHEWYERGFQTPEGGWGNYEIHHIQPRRFGGNNDFDNLVPVLKDTHRQKLNPWWNNYKIGH